MKTKNLTKCVMILLLSIFAIISAYGKNKNEKDSVLISIDEARTMVQIVHENAYLQEENVVLDSLLKYNDQTIHVLNENIDNYQKQVDNLTTVIGNNDQIIEIKDKEIIEIQKEYKKQKRKNMFTFGGGGVVVGILLTLILL